SVPLPAPPGTVLGGSYHAARNSMFLVQNFDVLEINPATGALIQSFPVQPAGSPAFSVVLGDLEVDPVTGNLLMVSWPTFVIREMTPTGRFVRDQNFQALGIGSLTGIDVDAATRHLWVSSRDGFFDELAALFTNNGSLTLGPGSTLDVPGT